MKKPNDRAVAVSLMLALSLAACGKADDSGAAPGAELTMGAATEALMTAARDHFKIIPVRFVPADGKVPSADMIALGAMLYHDPRLSGSHALSCASCHNIGLGGGDNASTSVGHKWQMGGRNAPTVLNSVFNFSQFWDGRAKDLYEQAGGPVINPIEMDSPKEHVAEQLKSIPGYLAAFQKAFPGQTDPITMDNVQSAIAAFEGTLITPNAPFDKYLAGDAGAMNATQKAGLKLFIDKGCVACHNGVNVGGGMYAKFGAASDPGPQYRPVADKGRSVVTKNPADDYSFKVPTLRNIALTAPYFHTGSAWDLAEAVRVMAKSQLGQDLSQQETDQMVAFLGTLTGQQPDVRVPVLPPSGPKTTRPVRN